ncbi:hypothetical protein J2N86_12205 [Legionella lytica]|uniref:Uncharacterized protein n=1 Tax=Legionella lytica TaxID=96232 RepID=A0ABY4Y720_9GAMM|nr:cytochrome oxidase putative small subunit CydP [Legionella lytica]USQ13438.1 hypothetical protein J2N86_12205 [Legionella lytica]
MIKPLTRDILLTLIVKFSLLFVLWAVCFKNVEKPNKNTEQWLLGSTYAKEPSKAPK